MSKYVSVIFAITMGLIFILFSKIQILSITSESYEVVFELEYPIPDIMLVMGVFIIFSAFIGLLTITRSEIIENNRSEERN